MHNGESPIVTSRSSNRLHSTSLASSAGRKRCTMCHFITPEVVYTSCLLWEQVPDEASAAEPGGSTSSPSQLSRLLRTLLNNSRNDITPITRAPGPSAAALAAAGDANVPEEERLAVHVIKKKVYFQCRDARRLVDSGEDDVDRRVCPEARGPRMAEDAPVEQYESRVPNLPCPACEAARNAVDQEVNHRFEVNPAGDAEQEQIPPVPPIADRDRLRPNRNRRPNRRGDDPPGITRVGNRDEPIPRERRRGEERARNGQRRRPNRNHESRCRCM